MTDGLTIAWESEPVKSILDRLMREVYFEPDEARTAVSIYLQKTQEGLVILEGFLMDKEWKQAASMLHEMKGTTANLRMTGLNNLSKEFEAAVKSKNVPMTNLYMIGLTHVITGLANEITELAHDAMG